MDSADPEQADDAAMTIDLQLPDEEIAVAELQHEETAGALPSEAAVRAEAAAVAGAQRRLRLDLLQRHGLRLENHFLRDGGEISAQLLGSLRVAMLSGEELRELAHCEDHRQSSGVLLSTDPTSGPISESSERKTCAALRSILNGLSQAFASRWTQENSIITLKWLVAGFCFNVDEREAQPSKEQSTPCLTLPHRVLLHTEREVERLERSVTSGAVNATDSVESAHARDRKRRRLEDALGFNKSDEIRCIKRELMEVQRQRDQLARCEHQLQSRLAQLQKTHGGDPASNTEGVDQNQFRSNCARSMGAVLHGQPAAPWEVAAGSMQELLRDLGLSDKLCATMANRGILRIEQILALLPGSRTEKGPANSNSSENGVDRLAQELCPFGISNADCQRIARHATSPRPCGASGAAWSERFLLAIRPANDAVMGCENMGPLLYALMRFLKPQGILEVGAGYTSLWLLQALADNTAELSRCAAALQTDGYQVGGASWLLPPETGWQQKHADATPTLLHCVDDMTHENTTAHLVEAISQRLGTSHHLRIHAVDAYEFAADWKDVTETGGANTGRSEQDMLDVLWLDFGVGVTGRLSEFLCAWWPRLRAGGYLLVHSTLTNAVTRHWLEAMRRKREWAPEQGKKLPEQQHCDPFCGDDFEMISLMEPHKRCQNSVSVFQKRPKGWVGEPVHTTYP